MTFSADGLDESNARQIEKQFPWFTIQGTSARVAFDLQLQEAAMKLALVLPPDRMQEAFAEVERRAELFGRIRSSSPNSGEHPQLAALESVTADVTYGRII